MLLDSSKIEAILLSENIPTSLIEKEIGLNRSTISRFRTGKRDVKNISMMTAMRVQKWINDKEFSFVFDGNFVDSRQQK
jgi:hypothetical protein